MTLWRWLRDEKLQFPQSVYVNKRRYFNEDKLDAFDRRQAAQVDLEAGQNTWQAAEVA